MNTPPNFDDWMRQWTDHGAQFASQWSELAGKMMAAGMAASPDAPPPDAMRQARTALFQGMSDMLDRTMRSPEFMAAMKRNLDQAMDVQRKTARMMGDLQHGFQAANQDDIGGIMRRLSNLEQRAVNGMERLQESLDEILERLDRLEAAPARPRRKPAAPARKGDAS